MIFPVFVELCQLTKYFDFVAKLLSCMDAFRSILGDHCDEEEAKAAILKHDFDLERAIDDVLDQGNYCKFLCSGCLPYDWGPSYPVRDSQKCVNLSVLF